MASEMLDMTPDSNVHLLHLSGVRTDSKYNLHDRCILSKKLVALRSDDPKTFLFLELLPYRI